MALTKTWREMCAPLIRDTIIENSGKTEKDIRAALRAVYPWGEKAYHPYKIWCDEINRQLKKPKRQQVIDTQISLFATKKCWNCVCCDKEDEKIGNTWFPTDNGYCTAEFSEVNGAELYYQIVHSETIKENCTQFKINSI
jgi:hypothetical protein